MRYLTIKLDKWGVDYNDRKRKGEFNQPKTVAVEEAAS
jgi:hypothetical protein